MVEPDRPRNLSGKWPDECPSFDVNEVNGHSRERVDRNTIVHEHAVYEGLEEEVGGCVAGLWGVNEMRTFRQTKSKFRFCECVHNTFRAV